MNPEDRITYFAETDHRNQKLRFGIKAKDRGRHVYVIGKTGMGKSTLLENMAIQDLQNGEGMAFIDPHGGTAEKLLEYIPEDRIKDVIYFAPFDLENPIAFNVLEDIGYDKRHLVASGLMSTFKKIWVDAWSARMEYILNNTLLALLEYPGATLLGVNRMLAEKDFRNAVVANVKDPSVKAFWVEEFAKFSASYMQEAGAAIQNKIGQFTGNPIIRNILGQPKSSFDVRKIMDEKKILIMNLSKGQIGEQNASLLGGLLITKLYLGAMSRADVSEAARRALPHFYFYVDEFQSFANATFADILSEARKYKLNLTIAHQYIEQMEEEVRDAVFGNVGTTITFRVGPLDAEVLEKLFVPVFTAEDIVNLGYTQIYLTLMVDGIGSKPFSARTLPPIMPQPVIYKQQIIESSQKNFGQPRTMVEQVIKTWFEPVAKPKSDYVPKEGGAPKPFGDTPPQRTFSDDRFARQPSTPTQAPYQKRDDRPAPRREFTPRPPVDSVPGVRREENLRPSMPKPVEEKKPFTGLKDLLAQLETGKPAPVETPKISPPQATAQQPIQSSRPSEAKFIPRPQAPAQPRPISLGDLKKPAPAAPSQNLSALKDVLAQAMKDQPAQAPKPPEQKQAEMPKPEAPKQEVKQEAPATQTAAPSPSASAPKKEVSEDVLLKILE